MERVIDANKICFIACVNDEAQFENFCMAGLRRLVVPDGISVDILTISDASSTVDGYAEACRVSDAKYKVYIRQDTELWNPNFISEMLEVFSVGNRIGIVGVVGQSDSGEKSSQMMRLDAVQSGVPMLPVEYVSDDIIVTQCDIPWAELQYDGSESIAEAACREMASRGYFTMSVRQEPGKEWFRCKSEAVKSDLDWSDIDKRLPENRAEEKPLVSVVMPVWNAEKYIGAAIESVQAQTYRNFELMLVEDCPTDNTAAVVAAYAGRDARLRVLKNDRNRGIAYTTNRAIAEAKGKYIALLDDDDLMTPWRLELQVAYLEQHPEIDVLGGCTVNIFEDGGLANRWYEPPRLGAIHANLLLNMGGFANGTGMIRRDFIIKNRLRYRDNALGMQDMKFYMDASPLGRFDTIPDVLLYSRQHGGQETRSAMNGDRAAKRAAKYAQFQRESLAANGIFLKPACMNLLNRICDEYHAAVCADEKELRQFTAVIEEIYRQAAARKLWFLEEAGACLASRVWEQCNKLGIKEPPKVTPADLPQ